MVEGPSGLLSICPPWNVPDYEPSKRRLTWTNPNFPSYGAVASIYSSAEPNWLRGPEFDTAWTDEIAAWRYPRETWDNLSFGMRVGPLPQVFATSTPKPIALVRELLEDDAVPKLRGTTFDNAANLPQPFLDRLLKKYAGTRTGRQELEGLYLEDAEGALWKRAWIEARRLEGVPEDVTLSRAVVAVDPAVTNTEDSAETGIVGAASSREGDGFLLADRSGRYSPKDWADAAIDLYLEIAADEIVAETNNGGDLVLENIRTRARDRKLSIPVRKIVASRGKRTRAEPIAMLSETGRIFFVGVYADLEDQLCTWEPGTGQASPDRLDAFVWAFSRLLVKPGRVEQERVSHW